MNKFLEKKIKAVLARRAIVKEHKTCIDNNFEELRDSLTSEEIAILVQELNVYHLELEKYNNDLKFSYDTLNAERIKFADLYDLAPVGYFILDFQGVIEEVNQTGVDFLCTSKVKLQNTQFQHIVSANHSDSFYNFLHEMQSTEEKVSTEIQLILPDSTIICTRMEGTKASGGNSLTSKYYIAVIDITESREIQRQLEDTKERLEMTLKASSTGTWSIDKEKSKMILDEFSYEILGLHEWEFSGELNDFFKLVHPHDREKVRRNYLYSIGNSRELDLEFRIIIKNQAVKCVAAKGQKINISEEYRVFVGIVMDVTERKKLEIEAENLKLRQQRAILAATLSAQENERFSISRALHDSICQVLYGIRLNLESLPYYKSNQIEFKNVNQLLDQAIKETREISSELTPSVLKDFGFTAGIVEMASRLSTTDFLVKTKIRKSIDRLDKTIQLYAFRIIQELLNNCIKHAKATQAEVTVSEKDEMITICVTDNGIGFTNEMAKTFKEGSGLRGIKNQLFLLEGEVDFKNTGKGTAVEVTFNKNINITSL